MAEFEKYWDKLRKIVGANPKGRPLDKDGKFYPDPTPVAPPVGMSHVADIDMFEVMRNRIRNEMSIQAQLSGDESFEDANDFEVDDFDEPFSPYEEIVEQAQMDGPVVRPDPASAEPLGQPPKPAAPAEPVQPPATPKKEKKGLQPLSNGEEA